MERSYYCMPLFEPNKKPLTTENLLDTTGYDGVCETTDNPAVGIIKRIPPSEGKYGFLQLRGKEVNVHRPKSIFDDFDIEFISDVKFPEPWNKYRSIEIVNIHYFENSDEKKPYKINADFSIEDLTKLTEFLTELNGRFKKLPQVSGRLDRSKHNISGIQSNLELISDIGCQILNDEKVKFNKKNSRQQTIVPKNNKIQRNNKIQKNARGRWNFNSGR